MRRLAVAMPERRCLRDRAPWALEARRMVPGRSLKAAESATLIQVSHPRRLPSESIRKRIDRLVLGHPDWTACCEDRRVRWASCKREVRDRGASPPSRALRGLEPTRILSAADGGTPLTRYVQARVPKCDIRPSSERRHGSRVLEPAVGATAPAPSRRAFWDAVRGANSERVTPNRGARVTELASSFWAPESRRTPDLALATEPAGLR